MNAPREDSRFKRLAVNRKARHDYTVLEHFEAGIALMGTEVKSVRAAGATLTGAHARIENGEAFLNGLHIAPYDHGNQFNHEPERPRRLLLHAREIRKLQAAIEQRGLAMVPLSLYLKGRHVKVELGLCKGKRVADKRETLRRRTADRDAARAIARAR